MQEKFVNVDGNKIRYLESGISKESIVLIHGLGASAERWEYVIPMFEKHYRVIVPDLSDLVIATSQWLITPWSFLLNF